MSWNHRSKIAAIAIAIQVTPGVFNAPVAATDMAVVSDLTNTDDPITAADPSLSGTIWDAPRIFLGRTSTIGFTLPMRGPGGAAPPALGAWVPGRALRAAGFAEVRTTPAVTEALTAGSTVSALSLAAGQSAVDDFWTGAVIQHAAIGTAGTVKGSSTVIDYVGATKLATIGDTIIAPAAGTNYTFPQQLNYILGTLTTAPPLLCISVWRDKVRYDYRDCVVASWMVNAPVANEQNTIFPSIEFSFRGVFVAKVDEATPLGNMNAQLAILPPANRGGKFTLDRTKLGHANFRVGATADTGAQSNANQDAGQDGYDILSGARTIEFDLNQMNVTDFDLEARINNQTIISAQSIWGGGAGNRFALTVPALVLDPQTPGDRNGYVALTGGAAPTEMDKSVALSVFW